MIPSYSDHAANERTFLAWIRTGLTVMALGFVIERLDLFLASLGLTAQDNEDTAARQAEIHGLSVSPGEPRHRPDPRRELPVRRHQPGDRRSGGAAVQGHAHAARHGARAALLSASCCCCIC